MASKHKRSTTDSPLTYPSNEYKSFQPAASSQPTTPLPPSKHHLPSQQPPTNQQNLPSQQHMNHNTTYPPIPSNQADTNRDSHPTQHASLYQQPHKQHINHNSSHSHVPRQSHPNQYEQGLQQASYYQPLTNLCENTNLSVGYQQNQQYPTHTEMSMTMKILYLT